MRPGLFFTGGSPDQGPPKPVLTAPLNAPLFNGVATTVSATVAGTIDRIDWVLDPGIGETVVATDSTAPYSQSWTPTGIVDGNHTLVARSVRGAQHTDSLPTAVNIGEVLYTLAPSVTCLRAWQSDFGVSDDGSGHCNSWTDGKNSTNAAQATSTKRPAIVADGLGLHTALSFDGVDDLLNEPTLDLPSPGITHTFIWCICNIKTWVAGHGPFGTGAGTTQVQPHTGTPKLAAYNGTFGPDNGGMSVGTPTKIEVWFTNSTSDYLKVGATTTTGTNLGNANPGAGINIGAVIAGFEANCDVYALLVFTDKPSSSELSAMSAAAAAMYPGLAE